MRKNTKETLFRIVGLCTSIAITASSVLYPTCAFSRQNTSSVADETFRLTDCSEGIPSEIDAERYRFSSQQSMPALIMNSFYNAGKDSPESPAVESNNAESKTTNQPAETTEPVAETGKAMEPAIEAGEITEPVVEAEKDAPAQQTEIPSYTDDGTFYYYSTFWDARYNSYVSISLSENWQRHLFDLCKKYDIDFVLALSVMEKETSCTINFHKGVYYGIGCVSSCHESKLKNAGINMYTEAGGMEAVLYLIHSKYNGYKDWTKALMAYNMGDDGARSKCFSKGIFSTDYTKRVYQIQDGLKRWKSEQ
jgi:hypothetical protein